MAKFSAFSASSGRVRRAFTIQCSVFKIQCNYDASWLLQYSAHNVLCRAATCLGSHAVGVHTYLIEELTLPARMRIDRRLVPMW